MPNLRVCSNVHQRRVRRQRSDYKSQHTQHNFLTLSWDKMGLDVMKNRENDPNICPSSMINHKNMANFRVYSNIHQGLVFLYFHARSHFVKARRLSLYSTWGDRLCPPCVFRDFLNTF